MNLRQERSFPLESSWVHLESVVHIVVGRLMHQPNSATHSSYVSVSQLQ